MYYLLWNGKEIIESDILEYSEAVYLREEYITTYGGSVSIEIGE